MKMINKILKSVWLVIIFGIFVACEDFMDVHKEYVEGGEIIYAPRPDSIVFNSGVNRIQFRCWLRKSPNVRTVEVSWVWNSKKRTEVIPVTPNSELDSVSVIFNNMDEGSYTFNVKTVDIYGNNSLEIMGFANAYDSLLYKNSLSNRYANNVSHNGNDLTINWAMAPPSIAWTEIRYTTMDNAKATALLYPEQSSIVCPNGKLTAPYEYRSVYIPEQGAIDTVRKEWIVSAAYPKTSLWVAGNGCPAEWNADNQIEMKYDEANPYVYSCETTLDSNGGEIKILANRGDWNGNTFHPLVANGSIEDTEMQVYPGGADLKWKVVGGQDGLYRITMNLNTMKIYFEKL